MEETGWQAIGRIAKARRERLGLNQEDLSDYGGPKVSTVGKFERAAQASFPMRTQQQMEKALGWSKGIIDDYVQAVAEQKLDKEMMDGWELELIEDDLPDLTGGGPGERPEATALEQRVDSLRAVLKLIPEEDRDQAARVGASAMLELVTARLSVVPDRQGASMKAAHEEDVPIEQGQGHDDFA